MQIDPFSSKSSLRSFLLRLKEDGELDKLIEIYIRTILKKRIIMSPSKCPYGEHGKDIVAMENEGTGEYCSYVVKRGTLQANLDGPFGILRQMEQAMTIELEIDRYKGRRRTVAVVHNGKEGYRGAVERFERICRRIESQIGDLLLRPIDRWDIDVLVDKLFEYGQIFKENEIVNSIMEKWSKSYDLIAEFKENFEGIRDSPESAVHKAILAEKLFEDIKQKEYMLGPFNKFNNPME